MGVNPVRMCGNWVGTGVTQMETVENMYHSYGTGVTLVGTGVQTFGACMLLLLPPQE